MIATTLGQPGRWTPTASDASRALPGYCVDFTRTDNQERVGQALSLCPRIAVVRPGSAVPSRRETISRGLNFTLTTAAGNLALRGEAAG